MSDSSDPRTGIGLQPSTDQLTKDLVTALATDDRPVTMAQLAHVISALIQVQTAHLELAYLHLSDDRSMEARDLVRKSMYATHKAVDGIFSAITDGEADGKPKP